MPANSAKSQPDYSQWPTKQQAAAILDCSTKTVETFADERKLNAVLWKRPTGGPRIMVYHPGDVEVLRRERNPDSPSTFVMPAPSTAVSATSENAIATSAAPAELVLELRNLVAVMMQQQKLPAPEPK